MGKQREEPVEESDTERAERLQAELDALQSAPPVLDGLDTLAGEGQVRIYKADPAAPGGRKMCGSMLRQELVDNIECIARRWGGADYVLEAYQPDGTYVHRYRISFDPAAYPVPGSAPAGGSAADVMAVVTESQKLAAQERKENAAMLQAANDRVVTAMTEMSKTMLTAVASANQRPVEDPFDKLDRIGSLVEKFIGPLVNKRDMNPETILTTLERGMDMGERLAGGKSGEGGVMGELKEFLVPVLKEFLLTRKAAAAGSHLPPSPARTTIPAGGPALIENPPPPPAPGGPGGNGVDPRVAEVKGNPFYSLYVPSLLDAMRHHSDVGEVADKIDRQCPREYLERMVSDVERNKIGIVDVLAVYEPEVREHAEWVRAVWDEILALVKPEPEPEPAVATAAAPPDAPAE